MMPQVLSYNSLALIESVLPFGSVVVCSPSQYLGPDTTSELEVVWVLAVFIQQAV